MIIGILRCAQEKRRVALLRRAESKSKAVSFPPRQREPSGAPVSTAAVTPGRLRSQILGDLRCRRCAARWACSRPGSPPRIAVESRRSGRRRCHSIRHSPRIEIQIPIDSPIKNRRKIPRSLGMTFTREFGSARLKPCPVKTKPQHRTAERVCPPLLTSGAKALKSSPLRHG
jgi:hypothetical protein